MIRVERGRCPASLDGPDSPGGKERVRAATHFGNPATQAQNFPFRAYGRRDVRAALRQMFDLKCAYCETAYAAGGPLTVEHYRPKGGFDLPNGSRQVPGYWWLGSTWTNLLPSCTDCNSERGHDYDGTRIKTGKANQFPLTDEAGRATRPGEEASEKPLLLDPTVDDPDEHLEFIDEGVVRAARVTNSESGRGRRTIEVLGLRRPDLVTIRFAHLKKVDAAIKRFRSAHNELDRSFTRSSVRKVKEASDELQEFMEDSLPYAGMARQRIKLKLGEEGFSLP